MERTSFTPKNIVTMKSRLNKTKIFIFDIGKTLFDKSIQQAASESTISSLGTLRSKGYKLGVCTMRTFGHVQEVIPFFFDFYILNNGAFVEAEGKPILNMALEGTSLTCEKDFLTYGPWRAKYSTPTAKIEADKNGFIADEEGIIETPHNVVLFGKGRSEFEKLKVLYTAYYWPSAEIVSIQNRDTSRLLGCKALLDYYGFLPDECLYFGDGPNDVEVFEKLSCGIAVGDCFPPLVDICLLHIPSCGEEGLARFVSEYF